MAFTDVELTSIRRHCGYPAYGAGDSGFQNWRFYQAYGLLEFRLQHLAPAEEGVVRNYLATLTMLEAGIVGASENLDTDRAEVWSRNPDEIRDRTRLFDSWRRRLCGFMGIPPGPALADFGARVVV